LSKNCGALDFNLGCSGYVYGLAVADGLIQSGAAKNILFLTAETYSKYIDPDDRSLRTIFGDAGAATILSAGKVPSMWGFRFGSDGSGADMLLVADGGTRPVEDAIRPRHRKRWNSRLYMDGPSLINFTVDAVPQLVNEILEENQLNDSDISLYLMHQATWKMLDQLRTRMGVDPVRVPIELAGVGNTVSCTIPILIDQMRKSGRLDPQSVNMLVGFGVGLSWAGCLWKDVVAEENG
ncbi:MAG: ketoacyl-ACP synthase III, partial [Planctomycetota bacterium]